MGLDAKYKELEALSASSSSYGDDLDSDSELDDAEYASGAVGALPSAQTKKHGFFARVFGRAGKEMTPVERAHMERLAKRERRRKARRRPVRLYAPFYNGFAAALSFCKSYIDSRKSNLLSLNASTVFIGEGINIILREFALDGSFIRFAILAVIPLLYAVSLVCTTPVKHGLLINISFHSSSPYKSCRICPTCA